MLYILSTGDALIQCLVTKPDGSIQHIVNLNAEWGNNGILAVVRDPWPMKYEMKFNVNTRRQAAEITANWNMENDNSNIRIDFSRAGTMNSQIIQETTEARVLFRGSSYAVRSELDWQKASTSHNLKLGKYCEFQIMIGFVSVLSTLWTGCCMNHRSIGHWR